MNDDAGVFVAPPDPKPRRRRKAPTERRPRTVKPAEYVIQRLEMDAGVPAGDGQEWRDVNFSAEAASLMPAPFPVIENRLADDTWKSAKYRIIAVKRTLDAKVETRKKVVLT